MLTEFQCVDLHVPDLELRFRKTVVSSKTIGNKISENYTCSSFVIKL